jgi:Holliday junction resolvasome RuvABC endonuclease subunit
MRILGFDASSTTIGYALLNIDYDGYISLLKSDYIKPIKKGSIIERLADTRTKIKTIIEESKPVHICIEEIIQFISGGSTAKTIITLTAFNRMIGLLAYDYLGKCPEMINVMTIRHGLKINKVLPKKEDIPDLVAERLGIKFNYQFNKNGKIKNENFDKADAIAVALYYAYILTGKIVRKTKK